MFTIGLALFKQYSKYIWVIIAVLAVLGYWYSLTSKIESLEETNMDLNQNIGELHSALSIEKANVVVLEAAITEQNTKILEWNSKYQELTKDLNALLLVEQTKRAEATKKNADLIAQIGRIPKAETCDKAVSNIVDTLISNPWK